MIGKIIGISIGIIALLFTALIGIAVLQTMRYDILSSEYTEEKMFQLENQYCQNNNMTAKKIVKNNCFIFFGCNEVQVTRCVSELGQTLIPYDEPMFCKMFYIDNEILGCD